MPIQPFGIGQRRRGLRAKLLHAGRDQLRKKIQLQAVPRGGNFRAHFQRIAGHLRKMVAFIQHQQQMLRLRQHRFALHGRHHQRMVRHHHFGLLDFPAGDEEGAFAVVVAVAVQTAGFVGAQAAP